MDTMTALRNRYTIACQRRDTAEPFSPEWDAALEEIEELRELARVARVARVELERPKPVWATRLQVSRAAG